MRSLITLSALTLGGIGAVALADPKRIPETFGGKADTPDARTEVRAVYGGVCLGAAGLLLLRPTSAGTIGLLTGAMAAGRAAGMAQEGEASDATRFWLGVECALTGALFLGRGQIAAAHAAAAISDAAGDAASAISAKLPG